MLKLLELRDFALIDRLELPLQPGLNAFTGETGAGKSILVDALLQLAGNRADLSLIRAGSDSALIQGEFDSFTLTRKLQENGRSSARIDGEQVTVSELAKRSAPIIAVHGQHAALELSGAEAHLRLLDRLLDANARQVLTRHQQIHADWLAAQRRLQELKAAIQERARRLDTIDFQLSDIRKAAPVPGEDGELRSQLAELRHAEAVASGGSGALSLLSEDEGSALEQLALAVRSLESAARYSTSLEPLVDELKQALSSVQATSSEIEAFLADFNSDPGLLERSETRLALLEGLQRKYGPELSDVLAFATGLETERTELAAADEELAGSDRLVSELAEALAGSAAELKTHRQQAAAKLQTGLLKHLAQLGMAEARFETVFTELKQPSAHGGERVRFAFSANPGEPLKDLSEVASGGELSRLLLAINLVAGAEQPVLVFDEVDAGTGGVTALAIGTLLRQLARDRQVLVVTHLPQVAAFADTQYHVSKREQGGRTLSGVTRLDREARVRELARMLSGNVTDASLRAAEELLIAAAKSAAQPTS